MKTEIVKAGMFVTAVCGVYLVELALFIVFILARLGFVPRQKRRGLARAAVLCVHVLAVGGALCMIYALFVEPHWIEVVNVDVPTNRIKHVSLTVVQISDLHCDPARNDEDRVVQMVNDARPDVIVFTGDAANDEKGLPIFRDTLKRLNAPLGKFAVRGNIDRGFSDEDLVGGTGFVLLDGECAVVRKDGEAFCIVGVSNERVGQIHGILQRIIAARTPREMFTIFIHHYPGMVDEVYPGWVDLSLCGHIHGGQVALPFYGAVMTFSSAGKKYERGIYHAKGALLYVNRGIGTENIPVRARFLARPEITVFHIHPSGENG